MRPMDRIHMARAVQLARLGLYTTGPNPRVGCVLVANGEVVGEGWHRRAGEPHAEVIALSQAGMRASGATAYVTLEPCCHHGRTPPCTDALIAAGVARVVAAMVDPNPLVSGRGMERLAGAGILVESGLLADEAASLNPGFVKRMSERRPYCRCKLAASLDGRTAMASGESKWISSEPARRDVHRLRAQSGAIVTGVGTVLADDPAFTVRLEAGALEGLGPDDPTPQPLRVVVDGQLRTPPAARMLRLPGEVAIACMEGPGTGAARALTAAGARVIALPASHGRVDLCALMAWLADREVNEVLIESGPTLAGAALTAGIIDELILYLAPHLMGDDGRGLFHLPGIERMEHRIPLRISDLRRIGPDLRLTLRPDRS